MRLNWFFLCLCFLVQSFKKDANKKGCENNMWNNRLCIDMENVFTETKATEKRRLKKYRRCEKCNKINTGDSCCRTCNAGHFRNDFDKWTSGNKEIDVFIQNSQIHACEYQLVLEWCPWETF